MKYIVNHYKFVLGLLLASLIYSCENSNKSTVIENDTITETSIIDSTRIRFRNLISKMPIPFESLKSFSAAKTRFNANLLNNPKNSEAYNSNRIQALNLGIYGADLAYLIAQDKLNEAEPFLKSIRRLSDAIVVPTAFNGAVIDRYEANINKKDSLQHLVQQSFQKIDNTLQENDRIEQASLVLAGGWIESVYLTVQSIEKSDPNQKKQVLIDILALQRSYLNNITELIGSFQDDSVSVKLYSDLLIIKKIFPKKIGANKKKIIPDFQILQQQITITRNRIIKIK